MLGIVLIYFIGKIYYKLAEDFGRHKWGYAILGIITYYAGAFLVGITIGVLLELGVFSNLTLDDVSDTVLSVIAFPFGLLATWGLHRILKRQWSRLPRKEAVNALDSDLL